MKTIEKLVHILNILRWYVFVIFLALLNTACMTGSSEDLRTRIQSNIKERVARIDSIGSFKVGYLTSEDLLENKYVAEQSIISKKSNLGAFKFTRIGDKESNSSVYTLYKSKGNFMAETKISESASKKYFFAFGVNKDTKMPALNLRVEF